MAFRAGCLSVAPYTEIKRYPAAIKNENIHDRTLSTSSLAACSTHHTHFSRRSPPAPAPAPAPALSTRTHPSCHCSAVSLAAPSHLISSHIVSYPSSRLASYTHPSPGAPTAPPPPRAHLHPLPVGIFRSAIQTLQSVSQSVSQSGGIAERKIQTDSYPEITYFATKYVIIDEIPGERRQWERHEGGVRSQIGAGQVG